MHNGNGNGGDKEGKSWTMFDSLRRRPNGQVNNRTSTYVESPAAANDNRYSAAPAADIGYSSIHSKGVLELDYVVRSVEYGHAPELSLAAVPANDASHPKLSMRGGVLPGNEAPVSEASLVDDSFMSFDPFSEDERDTAAPLPTRGKNPMASNSSLAPGEPGEEDPGSKKTFGK